MDARLRVVFTAALLLLPAARSTTGSGPRISTLQVRPTVAMPGGEVFVTVRIEPNQNARLLQITVDARSYFGSTDRQLDGAEAPRTHHFAFGHLPSGEYTITARLEVIGGVAQSMTRAMTVVGEPPESMRDPR